jgi:transposase IS166 family protein
MWRSLVCDDWTRSKNGCEADRSTCMPRTPDELLNDIAELNALLLAKDAALAAKDAELVTAKNGLIHSQLTIETLKAQLAKLRREKFGQSSERIERVLEQLELALEEAEAGQAESTAPAEATSPTRIRLYPRVGRRQNSPSRSKRSGAWCHLTCRAATLFTRQRMCAKPAVAPSCAKSARASPRSSPTFPAIVRLMPLASIAPEPCHAHRCAQFPKLRFLLLGDAKGIAIKLLGCFGIPLP